MITLCAAAPAAGIFSQNPRAGTGPIALVVLDAARDGSADLAVANSLDGNVSLLIGLGGGSFAAPRNFDVGVAPSSVTSADADGDGRADLIVGSSDGTISFLPAIGSNAFGAAVIVAADVAVVAPALGDFDGDRVLDLVVASRSPRMVVVLAGDRTWEHLTPRASLPVPGQPIGIAVEDINRDGRLDIVVARRGADGVSVLLNTSDGRFSPALDYNAGVNPTSVSVADLDVDGHFDLLVTNEQPDVLTVLRGGGDGRFGGATAYAVGRGPRRALAGDVNGDTVPDVVTVNSFEDTVSVLIGRRSADFEPAIDFSVGVTPLDVAVADFSGDGRPDIMTVNIDEDDLSLLLNNGDHPVIPGDVDANGRLGVPDIDRTVAELFDGDGDSPWETSRGYVAHGPPINSNGDARITSADVVGVIHARNR